MGDVSGLIADPEFQGLAPADQRAALAGVSGDKTFGTLNDADTGQFIQKMQARTSPAGQNYDAFLASGQPTRQVRPVLKGPQTFSERIGERVGQNVSLIPHAISAINRNDQIAAKVKAGADLTPEERTLYTEFMSPQARAGTQQLLGHGVLGAATIGPRLVYNAAKGYIQNPAAAAGDIVTASPELAEMRLPGNKAPIETGPPRPSEVPAPPAYERPNLTPEQQTEFTSKLDKANAPYVKYQQTQDLASRQRDMAETVQNTVKATHEQVRGGLNDRWNSIREQTADVQVPTKPVLDAIGQSRQMLAGTPPDLRIFNQIVDYAQQAHAEQLGEQAAQSVNAGDLAGLQRWIEQRPGISTEPAAAIPFDEARTQHSAIGQQWMHADGNLRRALKNVYDAQDSTLKAGAESAGVGDEYEKLSKDWSQYMQDWQGKGPLAKVLRAPHPNYVTPIVNGRGGELLVDQLGKYGDPAQVRQLQQITQQAKMPPPPKVVAPPAPEPAKPGFFRKHVIPKIGGAAAMSTNLPIPGHPLLNYTVGSEAATALAKRVSRMPPTPEAYHRTILEAKEGRISPGEADRRIAKAGGKVKVNPLPPPP